MKKTVKILALTLLFTLVLCGCSSRHATNEGYALYRSSPVGVEIEYPDFWEVSDNKNERVVIFAAPNEGFADEFRENVTVICKEVGEEDLAFDNYVITYMKQLPSTVNKFNKISETEMTVGENRAYRVVYEGEYDGETEKRDHRIQHTFIESGKFVYIYTFVAEPKSYDYFCANSDVMLETFKALKK